MGRMLIILAHLQEGKCTNDYYCLLSECVASKVFLTENVEDWKCTPIMVCENTAKDALNMAAAQSFAQQTRHELAWYYCSDKWGGKA